MRCNDVFFVIASGDSELYSNWNIERERLQRVAQAILCLAQNDPGEEPYLCLARPTVSSRSRVVIRANSSASEKAFGPRVKLWFMKFHRDISATRLPVATE